MRTTPIADFAEAYAGGDPVRFHMPGHKGVGEGEAWDLTEIAGADDLYCPSGIIRESESNASELFGCRTYYSTEGSSHCIRAMLALLTAGKRDPLVIAGRNAHKAFLTAAVLLGFRISWLLPEQRDSYYSFSLRTEEVEEAILTAGERPAVVYLTDPDYLGNRSDLAAIAAVCHRYGVPLAVDNAHGAYLKFLSPSVHPMDLGADICCDSAHKTLPVLTGGAYLHIGDRLSGVPESQIKDALALFGSTSPSYLILCSLDRANRRLETYPERLAARIPRVEVLKARLIRHGYVFCGKEPMKLTFRAKEFGYTGEELGAILTGNGIGVEFADPDFLVLMWTPENSDRDFERLEEVLLSIPRRERILSCPPEFCFPERVMSVRDAYFSPREILPVEDAVGRILAEVTVSCPPAVPFVICGERITEGTVRMFRYYGMDSCVVVK